MEIKRGMVFFMENPSKSSSVYVEKKSRPYVVITNDRCNASSKVIQVAPIISGAYDAARYYRVPFTSSDGRDAVINVSDMVMIEKELCTEANYDEKITKCILESNVMTNVNTALRRHLGIDSLGAKYNDYKITQLATSSVVENKDNQITIPNIHLTININGVPVNASVSASEITSDTKNAIDVTTSTDNTKPIKTTPKKLKAIKNSIKETSDKKNATTTEHKLCTESGKTLTEDQREFVIKFIESNYRKFGGTLTIREICSRIGISIPTVHKYINVVRGNKEKKTGYRVHLPKILDEQLVYDYDIHGTNYILEHYSQFGFVTKDQVYDAVGRRRVKFRKEKKKECAKVK